MPWVPWATGGVAPGRQCQPVKDAFGQDHELRRRTETSQPEHRLGAGHRLKAGRCSGADRPPGEPPHQTVGQVGNQDHPGEPLRAPFQEQSAVPESLAAEARQLQVFTQPASRSVAQAQFHGRTGADFPRGQVRPGLRTAPQLTGVEPHRRRQQRRIAEWKRRRSGLTSCRRTDRRGRKRRRTAVQPPDSLGQGQALGALYKVQHVATGAAAEAVELLGIAVHREAALGFLMKGADALPDPALAPERYSGGLHRIAQGMAGLQFHNVHRWVNYDHDAPPFARGFSPRRLRWDTSLPTGQRIARTAVTCSVPSLSFVGIRTAALPVPGL